MLSESEADDLREEYTQARRAMFDLLDDGIRWTTGGHQAPDIWATIDDGEISVIVEAKLAAAKHNERAAVEVRKTIEWYQKIAVYTIVVPRVIQTVQYYSDHGFDMPIKVRRPRKQPKMRVVNADKESA